MTFNQRLKVSYKIWADPGNIPQRLVHARLRKADLPLRHNLS